MTFEDNMGGAGAAGCGDGRRHLRGVVARINVINFYRIAPATGGHDQDGSGGDRPEWETDETLHFLATKLLENHRSAKLTLTPTAAVPSTAAEESDNLTCAAYPPGCDGQLSICGVLPTTCDGLRMTCDGHFLTCDGHSASCDGFPTTCDA